MTATLIEPIEQVETTDPTDAMFEVVHAYCSMEYPFPVSQWEGRRCFGICGTEATFTQNFPRDTDGNPLNPCPECAGLAKRIYAHLINCPRCGS